MRSPPPYDGDPYNVLDWIGPRGARYLRLEMWRDVASAVHMTRASMHTNPAAQAYVAWLATTKIMIEDIMRRENIEPFGERPLKLRARILLAPAFHHRTMHSGKVVEVQTHPARERDTKNLTWALEDAMQGALYPNDKWIDAHDITKREAPVSRFVVTLSERMTR